VIDLQIEPTFAEQIDSDRLVGVAKATLRHCSVPGPVELCIVVTDDETVRALNRQYRDVDAATDVLSFWNSETDGFVSAPEMPPYLGDVVISFPRAAQQASEAGHTAMSELELLTVHGVLHLLGHDHAVPEERAEMWAAQAAVLREVGTPISNPAPD
jgi:probable rRNA maturation factor